MQKTSRSGRVGFAVVLLAAVTLAAVSLWGLTAHADEPPPARTLAVLETFPVHVTDRDEDPEKRGRRLREIAAAVDAATANPTERAALLTIVRYESGASAYVHEGRCADGPRGKLECDGGLAVGHFQLHGEVPTALDEQAAKAIALWRFGYGRCKRAHPDPLAGAFQSYGSGGKCTPSGWSAKRASTMRYIAGRL